MVQITFDDWIKNPSQTRSRLVGEREVAQAVYNDKYNKMMLLCGGHINYVMFKKDQDRYILYVQLPSETIRKLCYDVIVEFTTKDDVNKRINNLNAYHVRFFSNDPNFIFTYAYTYNKNGLIIPETKSKIGEKALKERPLVTNPNSMVGYVKSLYFVYLFMKTRGLFNKLNWMNAENESGFDKFVSDIVIMSDRKLKQVQDMKQLQATTKKKNIDIYDPKELEREAKNSAQIVSYAKRTKQVDKTRRAIAERNHKTAKVVGRHK